MKHKNCITVSQKRLIQLIIGLIIVSVIVIIVLILIASSPNKEPDHTVYFPDTEYELNVYRSYGKAPGPTLLIIGGIHNEPSGYLTADQFVDIPLKKGNVIVVPRANFQTIIEDERGVLGDMNRLFSLKVPRFDGDNTMKIIQILKNIIAESDFVLNLHEGTGYYGLKYIDSMHNPTLFGQSIIADASVYRIPGTTKDIPLQQTAEKICTVINEQIENKEHQFHFNNHDTFSEQSQHKEQRGSATFYALSNRHIPAFGIETSKNISDLTLKVRYQTLAVEAFMKEFGIERDVLLNKLPEPKLDFIALSVNNGIPQLYQNKSTVTIHPGDIVKLTHIQANYPRGLSADIVNYGTNNDLEKPIPIFTNTTIQVRKDGFPCGLITVSLSDNKSTDSSVQKQNVSTPYIENFIVEVNGFRQIVPVEGVLTIIKGDNVRIVDSSPSIKIFPGTTIDFFGYWQKNARRNTFNDQGIVINTADDLHPDYSLHSEGAIYEVRAENGNKIIASMRVRLIEPALQYLVLKFNNGNKGYLENGETFNLTNEKSFEVIGVSTNIPNNENVTVNIKGFVGNASGNDLNFPVDIKTELLPEYSLDPNSGKYTLEVTYRGKLIGKAFIKSPSQQ